MKTIAFLISAYGIYVFFKRDFPTPLFLKSQFIFLDYEESKLLFYLDLIALGTACAAAGHYLSRIFAIIVNDKKSRV